MDVEIREFKTKDLSQIIKLFSEFGDYFVKIDNLGLEIKGPKYGEFFYNEMIKDIAGKGVVYIAEKDDVIIGFIGGRYKDYDYSTSPDIYPQRKGRILEFFVKEKYRGKGVGKQLFQKMEEYLISQSCHTISMEVFALNKLAREYYEKYGYKIRNLDYMKVIRKPKVNAKDTLKKILGLLQALVK